MEISLLAILTGFVMILSANLLGTSDALWLGQAGVIVLLGGLVVKLVAFLQDKGE